MKFFACILCVNSIFVAMRICAVASCHNSSRHIAKWKQDGSRGTPPFKFFTIPRGKKQSSLRAAWTKLINRTDPATGKPWTPKIHDVVCSVHFKHGVKDLPVLNMGYTPVSVPKIRKSPKKRMMPTPKVVRNLGFTKIKRLEAAKKAAAHDHAYAFTCSCSDNCTCPGCAKQQQDLRSLRHEKLDLEAKLKNFSANSNTIANAFEAKVMKDDKSISFYTGMKSVQQFNDLFAYLGKRAANMRYWIGKKYESKRGTGLRGRDRKLTHKQEFIMTLVKLRQGLKMRFLADLFDVSQPTVTRVFNTWIKFMSNELKPLIFWPKRDLVRRRMPHTLKSLSNLVCTIDCTETFIERSRDREVYCLTFSDYKRHNTVKYLVAIAPNGHISYLSPMWGGKASDRKITLSDGFIDNLQVGDLILADRGFTIHDVLIQKQVSIDIPPSSSGLSQMTKQNVLKTKRIARKRIHVERAIGRLKHFDILSECLPITLLPLCDDIVTVCAALCNLLPPLVC